MNAKLQKLEFLGGLQALGAWVKVSSLLKSFKGRLAIDHVAKALPNFDAANFLSQAYECGLCEIDGESVIQSGTPKPKEFTPPADKKKYGKAVYLSEVEVKKLTDRFLKVGMGPEWVARAVEILDGYYSKPGKNGRLKRDEYIDDYRVLIDWPFKKCMEEQTIKVRLNNAMGASSGKLQQGNANRR